MPIRLTPKGREWIERNVSPEVLAELERALGPAIKEVQDKTPEELLVDVFTPSPEPTP